MASRPRILIRHALDAAGSLRCADEFASSPAPNLTCPSCSRPVALATEPQTGTPCFAHTGYTCKWALETVVLLIAKRQIERQGGLSVEGDGYLSRKMHAWRCFSPTGLLDLQSAPFLVPGGLFGPHLLLDVQDRFDFRGMLVLVAQCNHPWTERQLMSLPNLGSLVLALDPAGTAERTRRRQRMSPELEMQVQSEDFIDDCLHGQSPCLTWISNDWCATEELGFLGPDDLLLTRDERAFEQRFFESRGIPVLERADMVGSCSIPSCPLHPTASVVGTCGAGADESAKCPHFIAKGRFFVGCSAADGQLSA